MGDITSLPDTSLLDLIEDITKRYPASRGTDIPLELATCRKVRIEQDAAIRKLEQEYANEPKRAPATWQHLHDEIKDRDYWCDREHTLLREIGAIPSD